MATETRETDVTALEKLAAELAARGFETRLTIPPGQVPSLSVINPQVLALSETVVVGEDWFWWSWAQRIAAAYDVSEAADVIARVLSAGSSST